jgi:hypothetical protein
MLTEMDYVMKKIIARIILILVNQTVMVMGLVMHVIIVIQYTIQSKLIQMEMVKEMLVIQMMD